MSDNASPNAIRKRPSLSSEGIYRRVKGMAARFEFKPGERINEVELSRTLDVSRTPLREVLNQLMVEGFVTRSHHKGFIGRSLEAQQVLDLYEFRKVIETSMMVLACDRATAAELRDLESFVKASTDASEDEDASKLVQLDEDFHLRIARLSRNSEMERALNSINARIHYIRWIDMQKRRSHTQAEHLSIVMAMKERRFAAAVDLLDVHISRRLDQIVEVVRTGYAEIYTRSGLAPAILTKD